MFNGEVTVILTAYRRLHLLADQIKYIRNQTFKPKEIWVWKNYHHDASPNVDLLNIDADQIFDCSDNWKYCGRFAAAWLADTRYIALFDDDTYPGNRWLENCMLTQYKNNPTPCVMGGVGVILNGPRYQGHTRVGWNSCNEQALEVDLVGHAWFFDKEVLKYFWAKDPPTRETGEDIHLSYMAQKHGSKTIVPPHPPDDKSLHSSLFPQLGVDQNTISVTNHGKFFGLRDQLVKQYLKEGWQTVNKIHV